jgi:hypothetical protein
MNLDQLIPTRPAMPKVSRVLHNSGRYNVCLIGPGLCFQSNRTGTGQVLSTNHPQFTEWLEAIETAIDGSEADMLCRAFLSS